MGSLFQGVYNMYEKKLCLFHAHGKQLEEETITIEDLNDPELEKRVGSRPKNALIEDTTVVSEVYPPFTREAYLSGEISPVFFGSAINNFGVKELLDCFVEIAPTPLARTTEERVVEPEEDKFTGFVFKIHANMDPKHRDRIAFLRIVSGKFERNTNYLHIRQQKKMKFRIQPPLWPIRSPSLTKLFQEILLDCMIPEISRSAIR